MSEEEQLQPELLLTASGEANVRMTELATRVTTDPANVRHFLAEFTAMRAAAKKYERGVLLIGRGREPTGGWGAGDNPEKVRKEFEVAFELAKATLDVSRAQRRRVDKNKSKVKPTAKGFGR